MSVSTAQRGFPETEFRTRVERAQKKMEADGVDALLLMTEPDVRYFTGFLTQFWQSPTRPWFLLVPRSGKPIAIIPKIGQQYMSQTWLDDVRSWPAPRPDDEGVSLLCDAIKELPGSTPVIGLLKGPESQLRMPLADFEKLTAALPGIRFENATALVQSLRVIKSENEIEKIRTSCLAASAAFARVPEMVRPGMSERDVFQAFKHVCLDSGADDVSYLVGGADAGGYNDIISPAGERKLQSGDVLMLDTGCIWDGYFCDFDRNYSIGAPSREVQNAHHLIWDATERGLEVCKPGTTCAELFHCMNEAMGGGSGTVGRLGHGLGMQLTEHPSHAAFDKTVLEAGMVLTLEPGFEFAPGKMMVHEENLVIREDGPEMLSVRAQRDITVIDGF